MSRARVPIHDRLARLRAGASGRFRQRFGQSYFDDSRDLTTSVLLVLPLFIAYQLGVLLVADARNGVDFMTGALFHVIQWVLLRVTPADADGVVRVAPADALSAYLVFNGVILVALLGLVLYFRRRGRFYVGLWPRVLAESSVYALLFGGAVFSMMHLFGFDRLLWIGSELATRAAPATRLSAVIASIGAGIYEEFVFRLVLMGGLYALAQRALRLRPLAAALLAVIVASALFSGAHYLGDAGDAFELASFFYRFFAGVLLAIIFQVRGFAVAVYTHALYDVLVMAV